MQFLKQMHGRYVFEARSSRMLRKVAPVPCVGLHIYAPMWHTVAELEKKASGLHVFTTCIGQDYIVSVIPSCTSHLWQPVATVDAASLQLSCPLVLQRPVEQCAPAAAGTDAVLHHAFASPHPDCKQQKSIIILQL